MIASIFLASFLGCLLALVSVAVGAWGVIKWRTQRFIASNAADIARRMKAEMSAEDAAKMQDFAREFMPMHAPDVAGSEPTAKAP